MNIQNLLSEATLAEAEVEIIASALHRLELICGLLAALCVFLCLAFVLTVIINDRRKF